MAYEKKPNELGALWLKNGARGEYMTGTIDIAGVPTDVVCFRVDSQNPKAPTWRVSKSTPRDQQAFGKAPASDDLGF